MLGSRKRPNAFVKILSGETSPSAGPGTGGQRRLRRLPVQVAGSRHGFQRRGVPGAHGLRVDQLLVRGEQVPAVAQPRQDLLGVGRQRLRPCGALLDPVELPAVVAGAGVGREGRQRLVFELQPVDQEEDPAGPGVPQQTVVRVTAVTVRPPPTVIWAMARRSPRRSEPSNARTASYCTGPRESRG
ncbi:hypothetical protein [Streptomyces sp. NPDC050164]|uniref:hypothetical protein n=1 Tax=Streptomyces sp. NPDC050164 TaxID=3365605 RepID=UPI0037A3F344